SRLASAVTISTGTFDSAASARIALSRSMPGMPGMFQSVITRSNGPLRSSTSAEVPSSASTVLKNPRSLSRFLTMRRMVEKSSTMRMRMFLSMGPRGSGGGWCAGRSGQVVVVVVAVVAVPVGQPRAQAHRGLAVDLAHARLAHAQHRADLAQVQFLLVVQRQHQALAFGQAGDRLGQRVAECGLLERALGRRGAAAGHAGLAV